MLLNYIMGKRHYGRNSNWNQQLDNYYNVLRLADDSTQQQIREAFMQLSKQYHPDAVVSANSASIDRTARFIKISEAYQTLSRASLKNQYDQALWMRSMANRNVKSGTYGFIHDFHCFGRHRAQQQFERNYVYTPPKIKQGEYANVPAPYNEPSANLPMPKHNFLNQMMNVVVTHMCYVGICGAIFGVVNGRCINHAKVHRALATSLLPRRRIRIVQNFWTTSRNYLVRVTNVHIFGSDVVPTINKKRRMLE